MPSGDSSPLISEGNSKEFNLAVTTDRKYTSDVARAILSTILFHRLFGSLKPATGDAVGITYPQVSSSEVNSMLNEKYKEVTHKFRDESTDSIHLHIAFFEKRVKKNAWFQKSHTVCWEKWDVKVVVAADPSRVAQPAQPKAMDPVAVKVAPDTSRKVTSQDLQRVLMEIVLAADAYKDHIPAITTTDLIPFPYEVSIS